jgi:hypothetical protein
MWPDATVHTCVSTIIRLQIGSRQVGQFGSRGEPSGAFAPLRHRALHIDAQVM